MKSSNNPRAEAPQSVRCRWTCCMARHAIDAHAGRWWPWHPPSAVFIATGWRPETEVVLLQAIPATFRGLARARTRNRQRDVERDVERGPAHFTLNFQRSTAGAAAIERHPTAQRNFNVNSRNTDR